MKICIVVPILNEQDRIHKFLSSIKSQTRKPDFIILVDGGSTDNTVQIALEYINGMSGQILIYKGSSIGEARQFGTNHAISKGYDLIVSSDADCIAPTNWLEKIEHCFNQDPELLMLWGSISDIENRPLSSVASYFGSAIFEGVGCNTAFRSNAFSQVSGYPDISQGEDVIMAQQISEIGNSEYHPEISVQMSIDPKWSIPILIGSAVAGIIIRRYSPTIGNTIVGSSIGYGVAEYGASLQSRLHINGLHIHHDILGICILAAAGIAYTFKIIPRSIAVISMGVGAGTIIHHLISEPYGCNPNELCIFPCSSESCNHSIKGGN